MQHQNRTQLHYAGQLKEADFLLCFWLLGSVAHFGTLRKILCDLFNDCAMYFFVIVVSSHFFIFPCAF